MNGINSELWNIDTLDPCLASARGLRIFTIKHYPGTPLFSNMGEALFLLNVPKKAVPAVMGCFQNEYQNVVSNCCNDCISDMGYLRVFFGANGL